MHPTLRWLVSSSIDVMELSFNMWNFLAVQSHHHQIMASLFPRSMTWSTFTTWTLRFLFPLYLYFIMNFLNVLMIVATLLSVVFSWFSLYLHHLCYIILRLNLYLMPFFPPGLGCFLDISSCNEAFQVSEKS